MRLRRKHENEAKPQQRKRSTGEGRYGSMPGQAAYSYSSKRSDQNFNVGRGVDRAKAKMVKTAHYGLRRAGLIILLLAIVVSVIKIISLSTVPVIRLERAQNNALLARAGAMAYQETASKYLSSSVWNNNKLTFDSSELIKYLANQYPELASASVRVPFMDNHIVIYLAPTQPKIILSEPSRAVALDANGRVILSAANVTALNLNLPVVTDQSGLNVSLGKMALTSSDVYFVEEIVGQLEAKSYKVSQMTLPAQTDELDVSLAGEPYYVKYNLEENNPRQQVGTFLAAIANLKSQNITPSKYIDVRVDGRAYYQ